MFLEAVRTARSMSVPLTRFLGLPWPEWGETDTTAFMALLRHEDSTCSSCGHPLAECLSDDHRWEVEVEVCHATAAIAEWREDHKDDVPPGAILWTRKVDAADEAGEYERLRARLGL